LAATLLEPMARNTAAAVAAAAVFVAERAGEDAILQVLASDHEIVADELYFDAIRIARETALAGKLVTFGISPSEPATGLRFVEKPVLAEAERMLAAGGFYWNSGIFMFVASQVLNEMETFAPDVAAAARESVGKAVADLDFVRLDAGAFARSPDISIDYAIM